jgi:hypothetical protein
MLWERLYSQLSAIETLSIGRDGGPPLNERGKRILDYLRFRRGRAEREARYIRAYCAEEDARWAKS